MDMNFQASFDNDLLDTFTLEVPVSSHASYTFTIWCTAPMCG